MLIWTHKIAIKNRHYLRGRATEVTDLVEGWPSVNELDELIDLWAWVGELHKGQAKMEFWSTVHSEIKTAL